MLLLLLVERVRWSRVALCLAPLVGCDGTSSSDTGPNDAEIDRAGIVCFEDATDELGIHFALDRSVAGDCFMPDSLGTGVALLDYDSDGDLDIYLVNGFRNRNGEVVTPAGANRLYRQEPDGRFRDVTTEAGIGHQGYGMGVAVGDSDNDGDLDLYITNYGLDCLYRNNGDGTFSDVTGPAGITNRAWASSAGFFDYDADGFLDVFVTNYLAYDPAHRVFDAAGRPEYAAPTSFEGVPDVLYHNNGDGTFTDVSEEAGIANTPGRGLGVIFADLNQDGRLDVYVANDGEANFTWVNDGRGTFSNQSLPMGLAINGHGRPEASMGIAYGDCDADGGDELFLTHLVQQSNTLYRRVSPGRYEDVTVMSGLGAASIDYSGFGTAFFDVDLDGDLDLTVVNGRVRRDLPFPAPQLTGHWQPYAEPNQLFFNDGAGRFTKAGARCGALCEDVEVSRGLAVGDLDADGDLDVVVSNGNGTLKTYRNVSTRAGNWVIVRATDPGVQRDAFGAVVEVGSGDRRWRRDISPARSYLSSCDPRAHFGLGSVNSLDTITVMWPDGHQEAFEGGAVNRVIEVRKGAGRSVRPVRRPGRDPDRLTGTAVR